MSIKNTYVDDTRTTTLVKSVSTAVGTFTYTYDKVGNILSISDGTYTTSYVYDGLNQLVRENDQKAGKTYTYSYTNGNITSRKEYAYTTGVLCEVLDEKTYTYGNSVWADLLTDFNGEAITYDEIGNPLKIGNKEFTWLGRQLEQIVDGENTYTYKYNADRQRVSKNVNGTETKYYYNGSILAGQNNTKEKTKLVFMYDNNGDYFGFTYNEIDLYYIKNAQNDVIGIANRDGDVIVQYSYDAWGNLTGVTGDSKIGEINPIRYRSYYYDNETGYYHLKTRYYDPQMCRFLNADGYVQTGQGLLDKNMFAYCENNPTSRTDPSGYFWNSVVSWFSNLWSSFTNFIDNTFGSSNSTVVSKSDSKTIDNIPVLPIYVDTGIEVIGILDSSGDNSKPVTVHTTYNLSKPSKSSSSVIIKTSFEEIKINISLYDIGLYHQNTSGNTTISEGVKFNFTRLSVSYACSSEIKWDTSVEKTYAECGFSGLSTAAAILGVYAIGYVVGQPIPVSPKPLPVQ